MSTSLLDRLGMLVTDDPLAELDAALTDASSRLRAARAANDTHTVRRLTAWIDHRLDQRAEFRHDVSQHSAMRSADR